MMRMRNDRQSGSTVARSRGKLLALALVILFAGAILAQLLHSALARNLAGGEAPDFALKSTAGENLRLSEYRSEVVALAFWASWCGKCRDQLPVLERLHQRMAGDGLRVLSVSFDDAVPVAQAAAQAARLTFPVLVDAPGDVGKLYDVGTLPLIVLIDRSGKVRGVHEAARSGTEQSLEKEIRALLAE